MKYVEDTSIKKAYLKLGEIEKLEILVIIMNKLKIFHYFSLLKDIRLINERKNYFCYATSIWKKIS